MQSRNSSMIKFKFHKREINHKKTTHQKQPFAATHLSTASQQLFARSHQTQKNW